MFNQESILLQDANGLCSLEYSTGVSETIGKFKNINPKFIEQYDNYTVLDGKVFIVEEIL